MGCWNKTCGLSNLHITAGSDVYVFVLEESTDKTDRCYSTAFWRPLILPFSSKYNDYGGGEESSGPGFQLIMDGIANRPVEMEVGKNEYHDIAVKSDGFGEEQFFESVHENRLFTSYRPGGKETMIDFVMMRKDIVDHILENRVIEQYVGEGKGTSGYGNSYIHYKFEDILKDMPEFLDEIIKLTTPHTGEGADALNRMSARMMMRGFSGVFDYNHTNRVSKWVRSDDYRFSSIVDVSEQVTELLKSDNRTKAEALLTEYLKGQYINGFMEATRKNWAPGGHEGSQSQEVDDYRLLINAMTTVLDAEKAEWDAENSDED
jgi:hypothetical protein